jgi:hypothetical protein
MIAAMGGEPFRVISTVVDKTDQHCFLHFLKLFVKELKVNIATVVLICDNHSGHGTPMIKEWCAKNKLELVYLPKYSSALNPVERYWGLVKAKWKKDISRLKTNYNIVNLYQDVNNLMRLVAGTLTDDILRCIDPYIAKVGLG